MTFHKNIYGNHEVSVSGTVSIEPSVYATKLDEYSNTVSYIGEAAVGSADDDYVWRIKKMDTTSGIVITWASGTQDFDKQWTAKLGYDYL